MMKNYKLALTLLLSASLFFMTGCGKDDDDIQAKSKTELLTTGSWTLSEFTVNPPVDLDGDEIPDSNLLGMLPACSQDDITVFKPDNTYTEEEGPTKCNATDDQIFTTGTWAFSADENRITFNPAGGDPYTVEVQEITTSNFRYITTITDDSTNITYTFTSVYRH